MPITLSSLCIVDQPSFDPLRYEPPTMRSRKISSGSIQPEPHTDPFYTPPLSPQSSLLSFTAFVEDTPLRASSEGSIEIDSQCPWPPTPSPTAWDDSVGVFVFPNPLEELFLDLGIAPTPCLPTPEFDLEAVASSVPSCVPLGLCADLCTPPYSKKTDTQNSNLMRMPHSCTAQCPPPTVEVDSTIVIISGYIELPETKIVRSPEDALHAITSAKWVNDYPEVAVKAEEEREEEMRRSGSKTPACEHRHSESHLCIEGDDPISSMSKVAHWIVRNEIEEHGWSELNGYMQLEADLMALTTD